MKLSKELKTNASVYKIAQFSISFACLVSLVLFILRFYSNNSLNEPLHILTSGFEEESLFSIWKFTNNKEVFVDFHKIPYAASYFNWFYYFFYGSIVKAVLLIFSLSDDWIPQIARLITTISCCIGSFYSYKILTGLASLPRLVLFFVSTFIFFGPLVGFWAITVRPDMWTIAIETIGFYYFISYYKNKEYLASILLASFCYLAWSFKQNHVGLLIGVCLFQLMNHKWKSFFTIVIFSISLYALTFLILNSRDYFYLLFLSQSKMLILPVLAVNLLIKAVVKASLVFVPLFFVLIVFFLYRKKTILDEEKENQILLLTTVFTTILIIFLAFSSILFPP